MWWIATPHMSVFTLKTPAGSSILAFLSVTETLTCHAQGCPCLRADSLHIYTEINSISWGINQLLLEMQVWVRMAICAHHATLICNDTPGNAASCFICNANLPPDHANMAQQSETEGANCAELASSNMRAYNWRTCSVCVKKHLHITSTVSLWGDGTLLAGTLAVSMVSTSCSYLFFYFLCLSLHITLSL